MANLTTTIFLFNFMSKKKTKKAKDKLLMAEEEVGGESCIGGQSLGFA